MCCKTNKMKKIISITIVIVSIVTLSINILKEVEENRAEDVRRENTRKKELINIYGKRDANRILSETYWIGMKSYMCLESLGTPKRTYTHVSGGKNIKQFVYETGSRSRLYLYFENDILTSYQTSN